MPGWLVDQASTVDIFFDYKVAPALTDKRRYRDFRMNHDLI
jgi:hypothetical protein